MTNSKSARVAGATHERSVGVKQAQPIDAKIGLRISRQRRRLNITMATLSKSIGTSVSQLAKYENGTNRISPARLNKIAEILDVPIASFFEISEGDFEGDIEQIRESQTRRLLVAFETLQEPADRLRVVELAESLCRAGEKQSNGCG